MSLASLEAFLERAQDDPQLQELLAAAPDAASVAAIARTAGFPITERDLWQASGASSEELPAAPLEATATSEPGPAPDDRAAAERAGEERAAAPLPDPWLEEDPLTRFVHQAHGDEELQRALASAPDAAAVAAIAQDAGYPISEVDLWLASGATPDELAASLAPSPEEWAALPSPLASDDAPLAESPASDAVPATEERNAQAAAEEAIRRFLRQAEEEEALQRALASAPDAAAVAAIAQNAGHPISELALWLASGAAFEEALAEREAPSLAADPLQSFLRTVEVDPDLQTALASAPDADTVAAIARIAGFPLTAADLWAASDAEPQELALVVEEMVVFVEA